ncbi:hypothetical protein [Archangium sp.]|jgi:hypothetical protein|uniref:hypothetical protein n=1 Tax=Archangium sp. TaxID=1872627 RepID=UPI002EDA64DA
MTRKLLLLWLSLSLVACARSTRPDEAGKAFKSSLVVLLEHRGELALTPEQVDRFEKLDFGLHERNLPLQYKLESLRPKKGSSSRSGTGGYMGGGAHDMHGGKGGVLTDPANPEVAAREGRRRRLEEIQDTLREMQLNDSKAYLEAEKSLSDEQKPRARQLISQEREKLLKQLEAIHHRLRRGDY